MSIQRDDIKNIIKSALVNAQDAKTGDQTDNIAEAITNAILISFSEAEVKLAKDFKTLLNIFESWVPVPMDGGASLKVALKAGSRAFQSESIRKSVN